MPFDGKNCKVMKKSRKNSYLVESGLASFADRVQSELVQASRRRNGGIIVHPIPTIYGPIVASEIVNGPVSAIVNQTIFAGFLIQRSIDTLLKKNFKPLKMRKIGGFLTLKNLSQYLASG